jgi:hypothetical protein
MDTVEFTINVIGETTGQTIIGKFKAKKRLSHLDRLRRDQIRRELLGQISPDNASPEAQSLALGLADLRVRLVETPVFWRESQDGLLLEDENVLVVVYEAAQKVEADARKEVQEAAKAAAEALKKQE